jgi:hypothetical protein
MVVSALAGTVLSSWQYKPVEWATTTANAVVPAQGSATGTVGAIAGILQNSPGRGAEALVCVQGVSKAVYGSGAGITQAQIKAGAHLSANATGVIRTTIRNSAIVGIALLGGGAATAKNDEITIFVQPGHRGTSIGFGS